MKLIMENWRIFIRKSLSGFVHTDFSPWSIEGIKHEYVEEILGSYRYDMVSERWPMIKNFDRYPFLKKDAEEEFIAAVNTAKIQKLSLSQMKDIHNHSQVCNIIEMYEKGKTAEEVHKEIETFFAEKGDITKNKKYKKVESYFRWIETFACECSVNGTMWPVEPPILVRQEDGSLAHISGQTRQTGALINKKIIPYVIIEPKEGI